MTWASARGPQLRVQETIDLVKAAGGKVAGVVLLVDRSGGKVKFGRIPMFSLMQMTPETWTAARAWRPDFPGAAREAP